MKEGFLDDYRKFRKAAKETGFDEDERKMIAADPSFALDEASEFSRDKLSPEILVSFFRVITKGQDVNNQHLIDLGNFLYNFRPEIEQPRALEAKDVRLINLGCALLENSFYSGQLLDLSRESSAALAFISNVLAKVFEGDNLPEGLVGFREEKLADFISQVRAYEESSLFPNGPDPERQASARRLAIEDLDQKILDILGRARKTLVETNWEDYFYYESSDRLMKDYDLLAAQNKDFRTWLDDIIRFRDFISLPSFRDRLMGRIGAGIRALEAQEKGMADPKRQHDVPQETFLFRRGSINSIVYEDIMTEEERREYGSSPDVFAFLLKKIQEKIDQTQKEGKEKKKQTLSSFSELGQTLAPQVLPEILADLQSFFGEYGDDKLGRLLKDCREAGNLINRRESLKKKDNSYQVAEQRLRQSAERGGSALPYLIKTFLIASDMTRGEVGRNREYQESMLATNDKDFRRYSGGNTPVHDFLHEREVPGPAYARLHFIPEDLPFSIWTIRYLRTKVKPE